MLQKWLCGGLILLLLLLMGCQPTEGQSTSGRLEVYTSIYPLYEFTKRIGGKHVNVHHLVPPGTEPHEFELSAKQMVSLSQGDFVIYNGAGLEPWVQKAKESLSSSDITWVNTTQGISLLTADEEGNDPHVWLDPQLAKKQAQHIYQALSRKEAAHKKDYQANYQRLAQEFDRLDQEYQTMVHHAKRKEFVTSHAAFAYLANRYGLKQIAVSGITPMDEPSPQDMKKIVNTMQKHQLQYLFFETLVSPKVAETVRREAHAEALPLNPLEGLTKKEMEQHATYFSVMRVNKTNLAKALGSRP
jgi:zinc transport system substrate-binding protein